MRFFVLALFFPAFLSAQNSIDVQHYRFTINLNDQNDTIYGTARITTRFLKALNEFDLNLVLSTREKKGMMVTAAEGPILRDFTPQPGSNKISLRLDHTASAGDTATFVISYKGIPADGLIISKTKYGRRSFFADNWPDRGQNWLPCNDHPADKASVEFIVTAPDHYQVVANGIQVEETNLTGGRKLTHWKETVPISTKVMVIGVADFAVLLSGMLNCIPVFSWVYPEDREKGFSEYALAGKILPFYIQYIGPYPYKKLANVQSKTRFGGLENANTIFYSESSVAGTGRSEALIAHEIAHQWFGNHATEKTFAHLWLSEGFATYMTILYFEKYHGRDTALAMLKEDRDEVIAHARTSNRPVVDSLETDYMSLLNPNSYEKGSWVLHMLRRELGDSVFHAAIRKYYQDYAGSVAGTEELRKVFESVSGKILEKFFRQWLYTPGIPKLKINWTYNAKDKKLAISVEQVQPYVYEFPMEISVKGSDGKPLKIQVSKKTETFYFPTDSKPAGIIIDPHTSLLFEQL
jgi:aminopeptidase N